jgi:hypothetical protein
MLQEDGLEGGAAQHQALSRQLDSVFKDAAKRDAPAEVCNWPHPCRCCFPAQLPAVSEVCLLSHLLQVPSAYVCPLTMEVFRDPVITPAGEWGTRVLDPSLRAGYCSILRIGCTLAGHSYERGAILEHLRKLGEFDPISRDVRVTVASLTSNLVSMRACFCPTCICYAKYSGIQGT